jgi:hypothetical protein
MILRLAMSNDTHYATLKCRVIVVVILHSVADTNMSEGHGASRYSIKVCRSRNRLSCMGKLHGKQSWDIGMGVRKGSLSLPDNGKSTKNCPYKGHSGLSTQVTVWWWRQHVPAKLLVGTHKPMGITAYKTTIFKITTTSKLIYNLVGMYIKIIL